MIVVCPSCSARFQYDEARFQGTRSKRFRCPKCASIFEAENPAYVPAPTTVYNTAAHAARQERAPEPEVPSPVPPPVVQPAQESCPAGQETAARKDREAMLAAAGIKGHLPPGLRISLAYLSGPEASKVKVLDSYRTFIGREEGDVVTRDPETSRRHATVDIHTDGTVWLTDLGSTNGTFVDGIQIFGTIQLQDRQEFTCGKSTFMLLIRQEDSMNMD
ncbi:MAG TPA: FHA domain-containing protein [Holophaga sp.]|nr:FHA domain-containing protein [Holophaga sp.]HPS68102.1 FHA domain-containing protein [Holophaga sp.]